MRQGELNLNMKKMFYTTIVHPHIISLIQWLDGVSQSLCYCSGQTDLGHYELHNHYQLVYMFIYSFISSYAIITTMTSN